MSTPFRTSVPLIGIVAALALGLPAAADAATPTELLSVTASGDPAATGATLIDATPDGRFHLFISQDSGIVPAAGDEQGSVNLYVRDAVAHTTRQVNVDEQGRATPYSTAGSISADGRYVVYNRPSAGGYLADLQTGTTRLVCGGVFGRGGCDRMKISADGRTIVFDSTEGYLFTSVPIDGTRRLYLLDIASGAYRLVDSPPTDGSGYQATLSGSLTPDNRYAFFVSSRKDLATNGSTDSRLMHLFRMSLADNSFEQLDRAADGTAANGEVDFFGVSPNGRFVAFNSLAGNLAPGAAPTNWAIFVKDLVTGAIERVDVSPAGQGSDAGNAGRPAVTDAGDVLFDTGDQNLAVDDPHTPGARVLLRRTATDTTSFVAFGGGFDGITADGRRFATNGPFGGAPAQQAIAGPVPGLDTTPPVVTGTLARQPNPAGWFNQPVSITWSATDPDDATATLTVPPAITAATEGTDVVYTSGPSCDPAGNCASGTARVSLDRTAPTVTIGGIADQPYLLGGPQPTPTCGAADTLSGVAGSCTVQSSGGASNGVGTHTATAQARDVAGNTVTATRTWTVQYAWNGFLQPINDTAHQTGSSTSVFKAGSTVPVKFQLQDASGASVDPTVTPGWLTPQRLGSTTAPVSETVYTDPADSGQLYRRTGSTWTFNWKTSADQAGYQWRIGVRLDDGTVRYVTIALR